MNKFQAFSLIMKKQLATLLLAFLAAASARGLEILYTNATFNPGDLQRADITLRLTPGTPLLPGLPALIEVSVSNPTSAAMVLPVPTLSEHYNPGNTLDFFYARGAADAPPTRIANVLPYFGPLKEGLRTEPARLMSLHPGESWSVLVPVSYDWIVGNPRLVLQSGPVRLWAKLCAVEPDANGVWQVQRTRGKRSNVLSFEVKQPPAADATGLSDLMWLDHPWLLAAPEAAEHVLQGADFEALRNLVDRNTNSVYAIYAKAVLARMYAFGDRLDVHPSRTPDPATGLRLANEVLQDPRFVLGEPEGKFRLRLQAQVGERQKQ